MKLEIQKFSGPGGDNSTMTIGDVTYGVWCTKEELVKYFIKNKCYYINTPHFSSLIYQNWCRNINLNKKSELHRYYIQIKWFSILNDIIKTRKQKYNDYKRKENGMISLKNKKQETRKVKPNHVFLSSSYFDYNLSFYKLQFLQPRYCNTRQGIV